MATSQFYSVCLAHESIRACRALLLASPCPLSRTFLHTKAISHFSFQGSSSGCGFNCRSPSSFACRAFSCSPRSRKPAPTSQNPREEIRRLDDEIHRLEKERRSVGKTSTGGKSLYGGKKGNAGYGSDAVKYEKPAAIDRKAKFAASAGSSRSANARALARYEQEEEEEEEEDDDDDDDLEDDGDDEGDDVVDDDDKELGEDFSSDAEMYMETSSDEEQSPKNGTLSLASSASEKPTSDSTETPDLSIAENGDPVGDSSTIDDSCSEGVHSIKHPWKEWNAFYDVLAQKNYFKDVPSNKSAMEDEGYLRFQSSAHMKHAILEFSRERDDIIRFLTKKHIKTVVTIGCPSTDRKVVNACKRLRVLCEIPEDEVCQQCKLKTFCTRAFAAPSPDLLAETVDVARVLYSFALNASPIAESQVSYPIGVVKSACHLVDEIVQLSAYPKDPGLPALKSRIPVKQPVSEKRDVDSNHRHGDWNCPDCNFLNFAKNRECRECGTFRESAKQLEPGDWECPECTFVNFRRNRECRECLTARPAGAGGSETLMPGEWKCPECQFVNFRRNTECHKCSTRRPQGIKLYEDEELEPGDWKCPECNFRNFKRNKNCKECGALSPDQGKKDDRWGLKKASGGGWGSGVTLQSVSTETGASSGRAKYQEWKPDLSRKMSDESDEDLEEDADVVFGLDEDSHKSSQAFEKKPKGGVSWRKATDEASLSDFDLSDLDDLPKTSSNKKSKGFSKKDKDVSDAEDDDEDDDNDMEDEFSEDEKSMSKAASKQGRGFAGRWDDSASDDEDNLPTSRAVLKRTPGKGRGLSSKWGDSDDEEGDGFSGDDDLGGRKSRGGFTRGGLRGRGGSSFGSDRGQLRGGRFGSSRGGRGESYGRGGVGRRSSSFSGSSDDDGEFRRSGRGGRGGFAARGGFATRGNGRGRGGGDSSDDDGEFRRSGGGRGGRGGFATRGYGRGRGGGGSSDDDGEFGRSGGGRGGRGGFAARGGFSTRGNGRGRGGGGGGLRGRGGRGRGRGRGRS